VFHVKHQIEAFEVREKVLLLHIEIVAPVNNKRVNVSAPLSDTQPFPKVRGALRDQGKLSFLESALAITIQLTYSAGPQADGSMPIRDQKEIPIGGNLNPTLFDPDWDQYSVAFGCRVDFGARLRFPRNVRLATITITLSRPTI
jgi:hypothetical protein